MRLCFMVTLLSDPCRFTLQVVNSQNKGGNMRVVVKNPTLSFCSLVFAYQTLQVDYRAEGADITNVYKSNGILNLAPQFLKANTTYLISVVLLASL